MKRVNHKNGAAWWQRGASYGVGNSCKVIMSARRLEILCLLTSSKVIAKTEREEAASYLVSKAETNFNFLAENLDRTKDIRGEISD